MTYQLLDSGNQKKLETFGRYTLIRPALHAVWPKQFPDLWSQADGSFDRQLEENWQGAALPTAWKMTFHSLQLKLTLTDFGHLGLFPEHAQHWPWMKRQLKPSAHILNLFAYSGATTLALARMGHRVCHLDAAEKAVAWAKENAKLNRLGQAPIRWIVDDVLKFVQREMKRQVTYDAIILDPPSFGRGNRGQVFKIERDLYPLLMACRALLSDQASFVLLTAHTPGFTPVLLHELLLRALPAGSISSGEMILQAKKKGKLPSGSFARWEA
ncbi:MAG: class I SAM-dependent methyltransferase [Chlamydiota bacterium]